MVRLRGGNQGERSVILSEEKDQMKIKNELIRRPTPRDTD